MNKGKWENEMLREKVNTDQKQFDLNIEFTFVIRDSIMTLLARQYQTEKLIKKIFLHEYQEANRN